MSKMYAKELKNTLLLLLINIIVSGKWKWVRK